MIVAKAGQEKKEYENVPQGTHIARCYSMIHIGTVEWEYMGEVKNTDKVRIAFELPNEMRDYNDRNLPMAIEKEYTLSMYEQANLRKDLECWRGKAFTDQEAREFDITKLLGVSCQISVVHKISKKGSTYATISAITPLVKGAVAPDQINNSFQFNYNDDFNTEWLDEECPKWIAETIKSTPEYKSKINEYNDLQAVDDVVSAISDDNDMPF